MPIRIVHTADNHIGIPFQRYPAATRSKLVAERFDALERLVATANDRRADFFVVAGDLFDSTRVAKEDVERTVGILAGFAGTATLVLPGNHDFHADADTAVWKHFRRAAEGRSSIEVLAEPGVRGFEVDGTTVEFFACPCPSKTGQDALTGWVAGEVRQRSGPALRIGVAHGNVTGLGLDAEGRYFTMDPDDLERAGLATWLLGHIHVPAPDAPAGERARLFMAGTHTPDSLRCSHGGSAWLLECDGHGVRRFERLAPGRMRFVRVSREVVNAADIASLEAECRRHDPATTILDLVLGGRLTSDDRRLLETRVEALVRDFEAVDLDDSIRTPLDATTVATQYRDGGLAARLLAALLDDPEHPDAATLAHDLIQEIIAR